MKLGDLSNMKSRNGYYKESAQFKTFIPQTCPTAFGKICQVARTSSVMNYFLNKIGDVQYTSAKIRLYHS